MTDLRLPFRVQITLIVVLFVCAVSGLAAMGAVSWTSLALLPLVGMAVTANQLISRSGPERRTPIKVAASTKLYGGTLAFINATGYAVGTINAGAFKFAGLTCDEYDNSSGSDGDVKGEVQIDCDVILVGSGFTQADHGKKAYAVDNYTVSITATDHTYIGVIVEVISATQVRVALDVGDRS